MAQERRGQRQTRYTGVLRSDSYQPPDHSQESAAVRQVSTGWRVLSASIVLALTLVLAIMFIADAFYVSSIAVGGVNYLTKEEIFGFSEIANTHVFWLTPDEIRENIMRSPSVVDAQVTIGWPPQMINIVVEEREPAIVWEQGGTAWWVDVQGNLMAQRVDRPDLVRVLAEFPIDEGPVNNGARVDLDIVINALQLGNLLPDVNQLRYDPIKGLGFKNTNGWDVWFGIGGDMNEKIAIYQSIAQNILARGIQPGEINVSNPDVPFYNVLWGR